MYGSLCGPRFFFFFLRERPRGVKKSRMWELVIRFLWRMIWVVRYHGTRQRQCSCVGQTETDRHTTSPPTVTPTDRQFSPASSPRQTPPQGLFLDRQTPPLPLPPRRNTKRYRRVLKDDPPTAPDSPDRRIKMN